MIDILIKDGVVIEGSGESGFAADVAIDRGLIVDIGRFDGADAETIIDAAGCVVTPGFVDMHTHADLSLPLCPTADSLVHQGITTVVFGQCGMSTAPLLPDTRDEVTNALNLLDEPLPWDRWSSIRDYLEYLDRTGVSVNVVSLVGQGTVRAGVMGFVATPANRDQMHEMNRLTHKALEEGAIGISTGLDYPPGSYASTAELIAFTEPTGRRGGYYFSHIRGEGRTLLEAISEAIQVGRETNASVQISHLKAAGRANWTLAEAGLEMIDQALSAGVDVTADMYPYPAGSTRLLALLPEWAQEAGADATIARLSDRSRRKMMAKDMQATGFCSELEFDMVYVASCPGQRESEGRHISDLADEARTSPYEWIFDRLLEDRLEGMIVNFMMSEENIRMKLRHPAVMIGTDGFGLPLDGPLGHGKPHPRCFGSYPRLFGRYVREKNVISLENAVWKSAGLPAQKLRWSNRGSLRKGYHADVVVFDPSTVLDTATYEEPHQYPIGIHHVFVNGRHVIKNGEHTQRRPGTVLRAF